MQVFEFEWVSEVPVDKFGNLAWENAVTHRRYFQTREAAMACAKRVLWQDIFGAVAITECDPAKDSVHPAAGSLAGKATPASDPTVLAVFAVLAFGEKRLAARAWWNRSIPECRGGTYTSGMANGPTEIAISGNHGLPLVARGPLAVPASIEPLLFGWAGGLKQ